MEPMPVTMEPDRASAVISQASDPLRPPDFDGFQLAPVADVHTATSCCPGWPNRPAAVNSANGTVLAAVPAPGPAAGPTAVPAPVPAAVVAWPRATTWLPLIATCWSTAVAAPFGTGRTIVFQERPSAVV